MSTTADGGGGKPPRRPDARRRSDPPARGSAGTGQPRGEQRRGQRSDQPARRGQPARRDDRGQRSDRPARDERTAPTTRTSDGRTSTRAADPLLPDDVTARDLDRAVRDQLSSLASVNGDVVARHLVMAGRLLDEDPELAYAHAQAAQRRAGRVGAVREAAGLAAYASGRFAQARAELRAARRITGDDTVLPLLADCERGLGHPERALAIASSPEVQRLDRRAQVEMQIVASGARRDLGQHDAALALLRGPELRPEARRPWSARLFYAYADALLAAGRTAEAEEWFGHATDADVDGETDAGERLAELQGITFADDGSEDDEVPDADAPDDPPPVSHSSV